MSSRVTPNRPIRRRRLLSACGLLLVLVGSPAGALSDEDASIVSGLPLTAPVKSSLAALQENWLQWDSAFLRGDQTLAEVAVSDLLYTAGEMGMRRLPDLSVSILARAAEAAAAGNTGKAYWAIDMAERLDPGSPEAPMTSAVVARYESRYGRMLWDQLRGYVRVFASASTSRLLRENLLLWGIASILVAGALFVALQLASYGAWLIEDLAEIVSRVVPVPTAAYFAALVLVILPILIPSAWVAFPLYWAILLAGYSRKGERVVLGSLVLFVLLIPAVLSSQARRVEGELSSAMHTVRSLREGRLYGGLFKDVDALRRQRPDDPAVLHLTADLHTALGQMEYARLLYEELLGREPANFGAHNNLGAYYLGQRNTGKAIEHLQRAASLAPADRLEPDRNLYQLYRDYLAFDEAESVLDEVRVVAPREVVTWVRDDSASVLLLTEGYARIDEIGVAPPEPEGGIPTPSAASGLPPGLAAQAVFTAIAGLLAWLVFARSPGRRNRAASQSRLERLAPWVPGLGALLGGHGGRAYLALVIPVAILLLPRMSDLGYPLPWGMDRGEAALWTCAGVLLVGYFALRWGLLRRRLAHVV